MIHSIKNIDWNDPALIGKWVALRTTTIYGVVSAPRRLEAVHSSRITVTFFLRPEEPMKSVVDKKRALFLCDTKAEAEALRAITVKCQEDISALDRKAFDDTLAFVAERKAS